MPYSDRHLRRQEAKERRLQEIGKKSDTEVSPAKDDNWIDGYFINLTGRVAGKQIISSRSDIKEPSIDLESSLKMFLQEAACDAYNWTDVNCRYDPRRSFPALLMEIAPSGLNKYEKDNDISIGYQPNTWQYSEASPDDVDKYLKLMDLPQRIRRKSDRSLKLMLMKPSETNAMVITDDYYCSLEKLLFNVTIAHAHYGGFRSPFKLLGDMGIADECFRKSLSLKELLKRVPTESDDDFRREQARLLDSFLDHLIKIQEEQRFVASSFSAHLEHLRKSNVDKYRCPFIFPKQPMDAYIWRQKHIFDSLCTMSRESAWLLKTLEGSYFSSPSSIKESNKILEIISAFISKFKKSKVLLDQYLYDESFRRYVDPNKLVKYTKEKLDAFGERVKYLQEQGFERKSVAEMLLGCYVDVVNMNYKAGKPFDKRGNPFSKGGKKTLELINEAVKKLNSVKCSDLTSGGSPLGCIALWRILFESSLINLRLDLICKNLGATDDQMDEITPSINELLAVGESVLGEFIAMHTTVAEVTYMLGDAFATGGAGPENFNLDDFPWDKHNFPRRIQDWTECGEDDE